MAALTEEQHLLKEQAASWVMAQAPVQTFREVRDSGNELGFSDITWAAMVEMGWTGILIPEAYGGVDLGYLTFGVVLEQLGRQLVASPLLTSALAGTSAVLLGGSEAQKQQLLSQVVDGTEILTLAVDEDPRHNPASISLKAEKTADGFELSGTKTFVMDGMSATTFIVAARTSGGPDGPDGITLFLVPADAAGLIRERLSMVDSRGYANIIMDRVTVGVEAILGNVDGGGPLLEEVLDRTRAGLGAEILGTASQAFGMTLEYLKTREQFGRIIGSFQALGHRAAELFTKMELARSCAEAALQAIDADANDVSELCSLSKCKVGEFLHDMSNQLIQIHGGIGMTDEFDAGFYLKRARVLEALYGNQAYHRNRYARLLGF